MKKKLAMRIASLALCVVFTGMLFGVPKSKAVVAETAAVAVGTAVLATCLVSFGLSIQTDSGDTIGDGISSLVGDYLEYMAFGTTAEGWLTDVANATTITSPGYLLLAGAYAREVGQFVDWLTETFELDEDGKEAVAVPGTADRYVYNGMDFPAPPDFDTSVYPYMQIVYLLSDPTVIEFHALSFPNVSVDSGCCDTVERDGTKFNPGLSFSFSDGAWGDPSSGDSFRVHTCAFGFIWSNYDIEPLFGSSFSLASSVPVPVGDVSGQLVLTRGAGFSNLAASAQDGDSLTFHTGLLSETLEEFAATAPWAIAEGTYAPTAELTQTGEGTEDVDTPDDTTVVPGVTPWLQSIFNVIKGISNAIVTGIKGLFIPSDAAIDSLSAEVDSKLPFIPTLQSFGDDLVYNLEHPEECADGLGLTTVVDLGKGRGTYLGNTRHELLDVSWYLEYKPLVDDIIVGFCWLCFLWNCYGALPKIIHGEGSFARAISLIREEDGP